MTTIDAALVGRVRSRLAAEVREPSAQAVAEALGLEAGLHGSATVLAVVDALQRERRGAGVLQPLLDDADVTDVVVNGAGAVHVDRGHGLERTDLRFPDDAAVRRLAQRLAAQAGRRLDDASPWVDARLPDGTRLHAVLAPLVRPGTAISLRVPARRSFTLEQLVAAGGIHVEAARLLQRVVATRVAFVVSGGTGSGKTTLLGTLLGLVPSAERLVVVEDAAELAPDHSHVVSLEARPANAEGAGLVTVRDLVRQALRMRPDRLVVGEVRGGEVVDLLAALNTGHEGGCGTIHATPRPTSRPGSRRWGWPEAWHATPCTASWRPGSTSWCTCVAVATVFVGSRRSVCCTRRGPTGTGRSAPCAQPGSSTVAGPTAPVVTGSRTCWTATHDGVHGPGRRGGGGTVRVRGPALAAASDVAGRPAPRARDVAAAPG
ncbi:TadA family conjugal transfer-associated ATPase [Aeromicrobium sp. Leaf245]|uniref:TadA family conjugal transfer-associated ATPase n=1 Tax=Aeromicrobium sp. Leaf245 TaxID=1736306 RepID=UPI000B2CBC2B